ARDRVARMRPRGLRSRWTVRRPAHARPACGTMPSAPRASPRRGRRETVSVPREGGAEGLPTCIQGSAASQTHAMNTIAIYNMKGGVGKTTMAVNLSFLAAQSGLRTLLWDLDPQAASSFAFRIRPHGSGFVKGSLQNGLAFCNAIRQTDYDNLCLLPAGFAYHKLDRLMGSSGNPERHLTSLLEETGRDFDTLFIDCPAGSSKLIEAILTTADTIVVPTLPTVLSLRMVAELARLAERSRSRSRLVAVFNMVDRRKTLHRRA